MLELYKTEKRLTRKRTEALERMEMAPMQSLTPIRTILNEYEKITRKGFDCHVLAESLKRLNQAL